MTPSRWIRIKSIYESALEGTPGERDGIVARECEGDAALLEEVERMLANRSAASGFFERPGAALGSLDVPILPPGSVLFERFRIVQLLGSGGMGQVYETEDLAPHAASRRVALKTLPFLDPVAMALFKNEFRSLSGLIHPHLVTIYELFCKDELWFFTMELVDGCDLLEHVASRTHPNAQPGHDAFEALRRVFEQVADGVIALHRSGKIHCDLKPSNILVDRDGRAIILDFGLVRDRRSGATAETPVLAGTPTYMPPEQARGERLSSATDWYAFGILLFQCLTGRLPFQGSVGEILRQKLRGPVTSPQAVRPEVPKSLSDLCVRLLDPEPGKRPAGSEIRAVLCGETGLPADTAFLQDAIEETFVSREDELEQLHAAFEKVDAGQAWTVFLRGSSGVGKTALTEQFLSKLREREDVLILEGRCYEHENIPYKALDAPADAISRYLRKLPLSEIARIVPEDVGEAARVFPVLRWLKEDSSAASALQAGDALELRRRAFDAFRRLLTNLCQHKRVILFIDDLQWGDADSSLLLAEILSGQGAPPLLFLAAMREEETGSTPSLEIVFNAAGNFPHSRIELGNLPPAAAQDLARRLLGQGTGKEQWAESIARESAGNPFYLGQLARARPAAVGVADLEPKGVDILVRQEAASMPEPAQQLLTVIAVNGSPMEYRQACLSAEVDGSDPKLLISLRAAHLIRSAGSDRTSPVDVYHDRVRQAVLSGLPDESRRDCHLRIATRLAAVGARDAEHVARHFEQGGDPGSAAGFYRTAAETAVGALAFEKAAHLFTKTLAIGRFAPEERLALLLAKAKAFGNFGKCLEAAESYREAQSDASPDEARELLRMEAYNLCVSGNVDRGRRAYGQLVSEVGMRYPASPTEALLRVLWARIRLRFRNLDRVQTSLPPGHEREGEQTRIAWTAATGLGMIDVFGAAVFTTEGLLLALRSGDPSYLARFLLWEATIRGVSGEEAEASRKFLELGVRLAEKLADPYLDGLAALVRGFHAFQSCRFAEAKQSFQQAEDDFGIRCRGANWELSTARHQWIHTCLVMGDYLSLAARLPVLLQEARDKGDLYSSTTLGVFPEVMNRLRADEPVAASDSLRESLAQWPQREVTFQRVQALIGECWIRMYQGQPETALQGLTAHWPDLKRSHTLKSQMHRVSLLDMGWRAALGAAERSGHGGFAGAAEYEKALARETNPMGKAMAVAAQGGLSCFRGDTIACVRRFEEAAGRFRDIAMNAHAWTAHRAAGIVQGDDRGRGMVLESEQWMREQGIQNPGRMADACFPLPSRFTSASFTSALGGTK